MSQTYENKHYLFAKYVDPYAMNGFISSKWRGRHKPLEAKPIQYDGY